jgi:hypothetical protein
MEQTIFAGLSTLEPGDALFDNGAAFTDRNIRTIDSLLQLGTVTHVHDAHAPLPAPTVAPSVVANATGGQIPANTTVYFGLTAVDAYGGETNIGPLGSAATPGGFGTPTIAPSAVASYSGGNLPIAQYYYAVTLADGMGGETETGPYTSLSRDPGYASGQIILSGLTTILHSEALATGWRVYRSVNGGQFAFLASGAAGQDTVTDDGNLCADCTQAPPTVSTTASTASIAVTVPPLGSGASSWRLYGGVSPPFGSPSLVGTGLGSGGVGFTVTTLGFQSGSPPPVSLSKPGANKINPATDMLPAASGAITLGAGCSAYGTGYAAPRVSRMAQDLRVLEGVVAGPGTAGSTLVTLAPADRPTAIHAFSVASLTTPRSQVGVDVMPDGRVVLVNAATAAVSLDGIAFRVT